MSFMPWTRTKSPYLSSPDRLADVIAAIQATATYKFYQLQISGETGWAGRIGGDNADADELERVFNEHPEFFRVDSATKGSLVLRRQHPKLFDVDEGREISHSEYRALTTDDEKARISRTPLDTSEVAMLVNTAIELHSRAIDLAQERRWLLTALIPTFTALLGIFIGAWLGA